MLKIKDILIIGVAVLLAGCSSDDIMTGGGLEASSISDEWDIKPGDPVAFTLLPSVKAQTRTIGADTDFVNDYAAIENGYELTIEMFGEGVASNGSAVYSVTDGSLTPKTSGSQLYWPDNTQKYGFKATAGTTTLETNQSNEAKLRSQDRLEGYAFVPLKDGETRQYTEDALNYRTSKQWKADNATFGKTGEDLKKIPLYLKHMRSKITIILKAGAGVERSTLANASNINMTIYSYKGETPTRTDISPYASAATVDYTASDYDGEAAGVATTKYEAIVEPYNYQTEDKSIARITLTTPNKTFTYKPSNGTGSYNLAAGQHLTITITLTAPTPTTL